MIRNYRKAMNVQNISFWKHHTPNVLLLTNCEDVRNVAFYRWTPKTVCYYYTVPAKRMCCKEMCEVPKETHFSLAYFSFVSYNTGFTCLENKLRPEVCMLMFPWFKMWIINPLSCSVFCGLLWGIESVPHWAFDIWEEVFQWQYTSGLHEMWRIGQIWGLLPSKALA